MRTACISLAALLALAGCAEMKTRYAGDPALACGVQLRATDFCANFDASEALRKDADARRAKLHCLSFYTEAVRSTKLLCAYFEELDSLTQWGEGDDSPTISAKGKRIHRKYSEAAQLADRQLEHAYTVAGGRGARGAVEELAYEARNGLAAELECREQPGRAGGLLLLGVAASARHDEMLTFERLHKSLTFLAGATSLAPARPFLALREGFSVEQGGDGERHAVERIVGSKLGEPELLAIGMKEVPHTPEVERYYAEALRRASGPLDAPTQVREVSSGRSLASVRCPSK